MSVVNTSKKDIRLVVRERGWGNAHIGNIITLTFLTIVRLM